MTNDTIVVRDIKLTDTNNKATYDLASKTGSWKISPDNKKTFIDFNAATFTGNNVKLNPGRVGAFTHRFIIPQNEEYVLNFVVDLYIGSITESPKTYRRSILLSRVDMQPGYSYDFATDINKDNIDPSGNLSEIKFSVSTVEDWQDKAIN